LVGFGVSLLMYISAVMYPMALVEEKLPKYAWLVNYNPLALMIENIRYLLVNEGSFSLTSILYVTLFTLFSFLIGLLIFNKTEKSFIDTV
jgi:lipopolysaccharide transport system permease protein